MQHTANIIEDLEVDLNVISEGLINTGISVGWQQQGKKRKFTFVEKEETTVIKYQD